MYFLSNVYFKSNLFKCISILFVYLTKYYKFYVNLLLTLTTQMSFNANSGSVSNCVSHQSYVSHQNNGYLVPVLKSEDPATIAVSVQLK
jgi:hypothetical protein